MEDLPKVYGMPIPCNKEQLEHTLVSVWDAYEYLVEKEVIPILNNVLDKECTFSIVRVRSFLDKLIIEYRINPKDFFGYIDIFYSLEKNPKKAAIPTSLNVVIRWVSNYQMEMGNIGRESDKVEH